MAAIVTAEGHHFRGHDPDVGVAARPVDPRLFAHRDPVRIGPRIEAAQNIHIRRLEIQQAPTVPHDQLAGRVNVDAFRCHQFDQPGGHDLGAQRIAVPIVKTVNLMRGIDFALTAINTDARCHDPDPLVAAVQEVPLFGEEREGLHAAGLHRTAQRERRRHGEQDRPEGIDIARQGEPVGRSDHDFVVVRRRIDSRGGFRRRGAGILDHAGQVDIGAGQNDTAIRLNPAGFLGELDIAVR